MSDDDKFDNMADDLIEQYLLFLCGRGPEPDTSMLPSDRRATQTSRSQAASEFVYPSSKFAICRRTGCGGSGRPVLDLDGCVEHAEGHDRSADDRQLLGGPCDRHHISSVAPNSSTGSTRHAPARPSARPRAQPISHLILRGRLGQRSDPP